MKPVNIEIGADLQELTKHGSRAFPFQDYLDDLSLYPAGYIPSVSYTHLGCKR